MYGGTISGFYTQSTWGAIYLIDNSTFNMYGGTISNNTADDEGGGVYLDGGSFTMNGGTISGNTVTDYGGGVTIDNGNSTFTMNGGTISNNSAKNGGGVAITCGKFYFNNGTIANNTADTTNGYGGGVYSDYPIIMNGGTISYNTAAHGGGIYTCDTFDMYDGTISYNTATDEGGGFYNDSDATFTMKGGTISNNTATYGNGVYYSNSDASFTLNGSANISDSIYLAATTVANSQNSPITITSALQYNLSFTLAAALDGYVIAKGSGYTLTAADTSHITITNDSNNCVALNSSDNTLYATAQNYTLTGWTWNDYSSAYATFTNSSNASLTGIIYATITSEVTTQPTCTTYGVRTYTATITADNNKYTGAQVTDAKTESIAATGHSYQDTVTAPTCTEQGYTTHTCSVCGDSYVDTYTSAIGHDWDTSNINWTWNGYSSATATFTCKNDSSHISVQTATITNEVTTAATCTSAGVRTYTATVTFNGGTYTTTTTEAIAATGHSYSLTGWTWAQDYSTAYATFTCSNDGSHTGTIYATVTNATVAATCTVDGSITYTATIEGANNAYTGVKVTDTQEVTLAATGHNYNEVVTAPTCTEQGYTTHTCSVCGDSYVGNYISATGHTASEAVTENYVAATCTTDGSYDSVVYCAVCGAEISRQTITIQATGHTLTHYEANAATCTTAGNSEYWHCSICGKYFSDSSGTTEIAVNSWVIAAMGHSYEAVVTSPTCTEQGYTTHTCSVCGESYVDNYTNALGHSYTLTGWTWAQDHSTAYATFTCSNDSSHTGTIYATITNVTVTATCTTDGSITYTATITRERNTYTSVELTDQKVITLSATGHTASEAVTENSITATCTKDGSYDSVVYCSVCGAEISRQTITIPATGHSYEAVVTSPTCTEQGYTTHTCNVCGDSYTDSITNATGHSYDTENINWCWTGSADEGYTAATATFTCKNDGTHTEVITAAVTNEVSKEATETEAGVRTYTATVTFNGGTYTDTKTVDIPATGTGNTDSGDSGSGDSGSDTGSADTGSDNSSDNTSSDTGGSVTEDSEESNADKKNSDDLIYVGVAVGIGLAGTVAVFLICYYAKRRKGKM